MGYDESKDFGISVVDGEHYTLTDPYGVFLRSFADGEDNEVDIVRFDK